MNLDTQMMYSIYHIEGVKIGVSKNPKGRVKKQGYDTFEILEEHTDVYEVSIREQRLQREYGYPVDKIPYWKTINNPTKEGSRKGGRAGGKIALESGRWAKMTKIGNNKENRKKAAISIKKTIKEKGLHKGEKNGRAKLTEANVVEIRKLYESGKVTNKAELGRMFNVSDSMIRYVVQYKNWN